MTRLLGRRWRLLGGFQWNTCKWNYLIILQPAVNSACLQLMSASLDSHLPLFNSSGLDVSSHLKNVTNCVFIYTISINYQISIKSTKGMLKWNFTFNMLLKLLWLMRKVLTHFIFWTQNIFRSMWVTCGKAGLSETF